MRMGTHIYIPTKKSHDKLTLKFLCPNDCMWKSGGKARHAITRNPVKHMKGFIAWKQNDMAESNHIYHALGKPVLNFPP
jgi:hypothetical protein